ncbi:MAG: insulinase family protein, partial [Synechococcales cyanobacterium]
VENTTVSQVQLAANKYLKPERLVTLVVGNSKDIQPTLSSLDGASSIQRIDISTMPPVKT